MKIVVIGEVCEDVFIYGDANRLSPEAPVPVFIPKYQRMNKGMAGNVAENLLSINKEVKVICYHQKKIIKKTRLIDHKSNHIFLRIDEGESNLDTLYLSDELINDLTFSQATIVSDYDKGFLSPTIISNLLNFSQLKVIDTKKVLPTSIIERFDFIKLNDKEFKSNDIPENLLNKIIITLGSEGAMYMNKTYPSPSPKETIDVSGAGDTFTAAFTLKYLETKNVEESIIYANQMASLVVSKRGVVTPNS